MFLVTEVFLCDWFIFPITAASCALLTPPTLTCWILFHFHGFSALWAIEKYSTVSTASSPSVKNFPHLCPSKLKAWGTYAGKGACSLLSLTPHSSSSLQAAREAPRAGLCKRGNILLSDQEFLVALFFLFLFSMWQILIWVGCSLCARNCSRCWGYGGNQGRKDFWPQGILIQGYSNAASLLRMFWVTCLEDLIYPQIVRHSWGSSLSFPLGIPFLHYG